MTVEDGLVGGLAVIRAVRQHRGNRALDLVEQRADPGRVALVRGGQLGGQDVAAVGIDGEVQPAPAPARLAAVFLMKLLARPNDLGMIWNVELAGWPHIDVAIWVLAASFMFALGA